MGPSTFDCVLEVDSHQVPQIKENNELIRILKTTTKKNVVLQLKQTYIVEKIKIT